MPSPAVAAESGTTLIELLFAIVLLGGAAAVLLSSTAALILGTRVQDARAAGQAFVAAAGATIDAIAFVPCAEPADYGDGLPDGVTVSKVETWAGGAFRAGGDPADAACSASGLQRLTLQKMTQGQVQTAVVVKRRAAPPARVPAVVPTAEQAWAPVGATVRASVLVSGSVGTPTGIVRFHLYADPGCSGEPVHGPEDKALTDGAATSDGFVTSSPGTYFWLVTYPADGNYAAGTSGCGAPGTTVDVG